jgi:1,4-alpha-glucan branching enzyme
MWAHPGKQLLFQGQEFGQEREWSESRSLDWHLLDEPLHAGIKALVGDMNRAYRTMPALWTMDVTPEGFSWIDANDASGNVLSFLRNGVDADGNPTVMACIANFSGTPKPDYRVGLPFAGRWREVLNTDAQPYGGSGVGNLGAVEADQQVWHGRPASAVLQLPPSGVLWLAPEPVEGAVRRAGTAGAAGVSSADESITAEPAAAEPTTAEPTTTEPTTAPEPVTPASAAVGSGVAMPTVTEPVGQAEIGEPTVTEPVGQAEIAEPAPVGADDPETAEDEAEVWITPSTTSPAATGHSAATTEAAESGSRPVGPADMEDRGADDSSATQ